MIWLRTIWTLIKWWGLGVIILGTLYAIFLLISTYSALAATIYSVTLLVVFVILAVIGEKHSIEAFDSMHRNLDNIRRNLGIKD